MNFQCDKFVERISALPVTDESLMPETGPRMFTGTNSLVNYGRLETNWKNRSIQVPWKSNETYWKSADASRSDIEHECISIYKK